MGGGDGGLDGRMGVCLCNSVVARGKLEGPEGRGRAGCILGCPFLLGGVSYLRLRLRALGGCHPRKNEEWQGPEARGFSVKVHPLPEASPRQKMAFPHQVIPLWRSRYRFSDPNTRKSSRPSMGRTENNYHAAHASVPLPSFIASFSGGPLPFTPRGLLPLHA